MDVHAVLATQLVPDQPFQPVEAVDRHGLVVVLLDVQLGQARSARRRRFVASGNRSQSISASPSSCGTKIGFGACEAKVDLPMPSMP